MNDEPRADAGDSASGAGGAPDPSIRRLCALALAWGVVTLLLLWLFKRRFQG